MKKLSLLIGLFCLVGCVSGPSIESSKNSDERFKEEAVVEELIIDSGEISEEEAVEEIFEELIRVEMLQAEKKSKDRTYDFTDNSDGMSHNDLYTDAMIERVEESLLETTTLETKRPHDNLDIRENYSYKDWLENQVIEILEEYAPIVRLDIKIVDVELVEIEKQKEFKGVLNTTEPCPQCSDGRGEYDHSLNVFINSERILVTIN